MKVLTGDVKKWHNERMEEKSTIETLVNKLESLEVSSTKTKSAFLDHPKVKKMLVKKLGEGVTMKVVLQTLKESGNKLSMATLRKWMRDNGIAARGTLKHT